MKARFASQDRWRWIESRAGCVLTRAASVIEAVDAAGTITGMVAFDEWTPSGARMHVAIDKPMAVRALNRVAWLFLFELQDKQIAFGTVRASNKRALDFDCGLGFRAVGAVKDGWAMGEDMILLEMRKSDCRWLKAKG